MFKYALGAHPGEGGGEHTRPSPQKHATCAADQLLLSLQLVLCSQLDLMQSLSPCS